MQASLSNVTYFLVIKQKFAVTQFLSFGINARLKELRVQALVNQSGCWPLAKSPIFFTANRP